MDIKLPHSLLKDYLQTPLPPTDIAQMLSLCGPTVDRLHTTPVDAVYDIEVITNRIDMACAFGIAREAAAILPQFDHPAKLINNPADLTPKSLGKLPAHPPAKIQVLDQSLLPRLACISLKNITVKPSDEKTKKILDQSGLRPLNNVIDISNELTLRFGLPVHIFDLDKIKDASLTLRESKKGETLTTLDGKTNLLPGKDIIIADGQGRLIDLCGIMGGQLSEVDDHTTNVLLFVPVYEPKHIRKTSLAVQNRTLAAQIYEKGPDTALVLPVLVAGVQMLEARAGGTISSNIFDYYPAKPQPQTLNFDPDRVNELIGDYLPVEKQLEILHSLGFTTKAVGASYQTTIPSWRRHEVTIFEDLVEEIARIHGYFRLPGRLPATISAEVLQLTLLDWETKAKHFLAGLGFTEVLTSSLTPIKTDLHLANPLSEDFAYLRSSLIPGLLETFFQNRQLEKTKIFELSNIYQESGKKLPHEISTLAFALQDSDYRTAKGVLEALAHHLHLHLDFQPLTQETGHPFITSQTAQILIGKEVVGRLGPLAPSLVAAHSLKFSPMFAEINFEQLVKFASPIHQAVALPQYPSIFEDITLESTKPIGDILKKLQTANKLIINVTYLTSLDQKHTFRLEFNHPQRNLTQKEVNQIKEKLSRSV